jgi:predicted DNA-binding transcriptional regulator YafY
MRADRLLSILMLLQTRGRMSAGQLAGELEVCERTIYRDMVALSTAGVPVYGEAGPDGGYQLVGSYRTNLTGLSEGEARALFVLNVPGLLTRLGLSQEFKAAMLKLAAALPEPRRREEERVRQRYIIDPTWWDQAEEPLPHLQAIQQAVWEDRKLTISYVPIFDVQIERVVDPYGLAAKAGSWYLVFAHGGRVRARRVTDLQDARLGNEKFERPVDFNLAEFWQTWCAEEEQNASGYPVTVRVAPGALPLVIRWFGARVRDQLAGAPEDEGGNRILTLYFRWIDEARNRLLPLGSSVEVLEPYALRASLADVAEQTASLYRKK